MSTEDRHHQDRILDIGRRRDLLLARFKDRLDKGGDKQARMSRQGLEHLERVMNLMQGYEGSVTDVNLRDACIELAELDLKLAEQLLAGDESK